MVFDTPDKSQKEGTPATSARATPDNASPELLAELGAARARELAAQEKLGSPAYLSNCYHEAALQKMGEGEFREAVGFLKKVSIILSSL